MGIPKDPITETEDSHNPMMRVFSWTPKHHVTMGPWIPRDSIPFIYWWVSTGKKPMFSS